MTTLANMRAAAEARFAEFLAACRAHAFPDEWAAYKAENAGTPWPPALAEAHAAWMHDLHAYYGLRDGPGGVLGGRGL